MSPFYHSSYTLSFLHSCSTLDFDFMWTLFLFFNFFSLNTPSFVHPTSFFSPSLLSLLSCSPYSIHTLSLSFNPPFFFSLILLSLSTMKRQAIKLPHRPSVEANHFLSAVVPSHTHRHSYHVGGRFLIPIGRLVLRRIRYAMERGLVAVPVAEEIEERKMERRRENKRGRSWWLWGFLSVFVEWLRGFVSVVESEGNEEEVVRLPLVMTGGSCAKTEIS